MTEGSLKNDVSAIMDKGFWLRILKKNNKTNTSLEVDDEEDIWGWPVHVFSSIDPRVWKAEINWPYATGTGEMGDG